MVWGYFLWNFLCSWNKPAQNCEFCWTHNNQHKPNTHHLLYFSSVVIDQIGDCLRHGIKASPSWLALVKWADQSFGHFYHRVAWSWWSERTPLGIFTTGWLCLGEVSGSFLWAFLPPGGLVLVKWADHSFGHFYHRVAWSIIKPIEMLFDDIVMILLDLLWIYFRFGLYNLCEREPLTPQPPSRPLDAGERPMSAGTESLIQAMAGVEGLVWTAPVEPEFNENDLNSEPEDRTSDICEVG